MEHEFEDLNGEDAGTNEAAPMVELETDAAGDDFEIEIEGDEPETPNEDDGVDGDAAQPDEGAQPEAAGGDVDDDLQPYSRKVQKRIMRERKIAREAIADKARLEAELVTERARRNEAEAHLVTTAESNIDAQIAAKRSELISAKENGDTEAELNLLDELDQLRDDKKIVRRAKESQPTSPAEDASDKPAPKLNPLTAKWLSQNAWMNDKRYTAQIMTTRAIDSQMAQQGWDPSTPEYFVELDSRINDVVKVPKAAAETPRPPPKPRLSPVAPAGDGGDTMPRNPNKVVLTKADLASMERVGLDVRNKDHLREYARNKMNSARG